MLRNTFIHLPGIGVQRERAIWNRGILDWESFLTSDSAKLQGMHKEAVGWIRRSQDALTSRDIRFFGDQLPCQEMWRLYREFADQALFLDIETTGLSPDYSEVTMIGALNRGAPALFINGVNLDQFPAYIRQFPLLVTFNGSMFDVPFLRRHFPEARLDQSHIDLRFVLASLGYRGGLKAIERQLGLVRGEAIRDVDGFEAVRLWRRYKRGDRKALLKLALYNLTDVINLVELAEIAVRNKQELLAFPGETAVENALDASEFDAETIEAWIVERLGWPAQ